MSLDNKNEIRVRLTKDNFIIAYLKLWNGALKLTDKEFDVMVEFITVYYNAMKSGVSEPYLSEIIFSLKQTKEIRDKLKISHQNWHNYKNKLIAKKIFIEVDGVVTINELLIPREQITFKFDVI